MKRKRRQNSHLARETLRKPVRSQWKDGRPRHHVHEPRVRYNRQFEKPSKSALEASE